MTLTRKSLTKIKDTTKYYDHQIEGIRTLARINSFLLADEMGLGKSLQALTVAAIDFEAGYASRVLIVAPATLKWNWLEEIERHTTFSAVVLDGSPKQRTAILGEFGMGDHDVLIVNYEQVGPHLDLLNSLGFDIVIFDEAHTIKNPKAKRTKAALALKAQRSFLLTGSPILNNVDELWALLHRIDPYEFPNYWKFIARYAVYGGYKDKQIVGVKNQAELTDRLRRVMLRREKRQVLDLPEKQRIQIVVDLHPEQRKLYRQADEELRIELPSDPNPMEIENALTKFLRLKQICGTTATIEGHPDHSIKLDRAVEMIEEITDLGEHVVVFTQFRGVQAALASRLRNLKHPVPTTVINGDTPNRDRVPLVGEWGSGPPGALVAMLQVAGVGLNMTAASRCIFIDKLFVPKLNEQAEDRLHRIGADLTKPVQIYELIALNTIESRIEAILRRKTRLFGSLIETSDWKRNLVQALREKEE